MYAYTVSSCVKRKLLGDEVINTAFFPSYILIFLVCYTESLKKEKKVLY